MQKEFDAIFYDLGGTLRLVQRDEAFEARARRRIAELCGETGDPDAFCKFLDYRYEGYRKWCFETMREAPEAELWTKWLVPEYPRELIEKNAIELTIEFRNKDGRRVVAPNGAQSVKDLYANGYKLGIISNLVTSREIPDWLERDHLTEYFGAVLLSCVEGSNIVVIDQRVSGTGIQVASEIGGRTPLHATSQGKLLLSQLPDATVRYLMNGQGMDPFTPHTIVTLPDLLEELEHIRRKGCAIENGEYKIGLRSVSAPVFDREGQMRYTLTVVGLFRHVTSGEFEEAVDMVCAAAGSLSRELGYHA